MTSDYYGQVTLFSYFGITIILLIEKTRIMDSKNRLKTSLKLLAAVMGFLAFNIGGADKVNAQGTINAQIGFGTDIPTFTNYLPAYRFSSTSTNTSNRTYVIYEESELIAAGILPGMSISSIGFEKANGGTDPSSNLEMNIWMRTGNTQPPLGTTSWTAATSGATQVYSNTNVTFNDTDNWVDFNFSTPFAYTGGTLEIAIENDVSGSSPYGTDNWEWIYDNSFGTDHVVGSVGSSFGTSLTSSASYSYRTNTRFSAIPPSGTDAGLIDFIEPSAACAGSNDVVVALQNFGGDSILTATIDWTLDGTPQTAVTWNGQINTGDSTHVNLGSFTSTANTNYNIEAFITSVGPGNDSNAVNDTVSMSYTPALNGVYTIDAGQPGGGTNYQTFSAAASDLNTSGVCGPVTFNVASGSYNEQVLLEDIPGSSATNTVTFMGAGAANTILTFAQNTSADRYTLRLDGASHVTFDSLTIEADDAGSYGWGVHVMNNVEDFTLQNCSVMVDPSQTASTRSAIIVSSNPTGFSAVSGTSDLTFDNNYISGGYYGIRAQGSSGNELTNLIFTNNTIEEVYYYSSYFLYVDDLNFDQNTINMERNFGNSTTASYAFYGSYVSDFVLSNNHITNPGSYGFYLTNCFGTAANPSAVANNAIGGGFTSTSATTTAGIRVLNTNTEHVDFVHNSINMDSGDGRAFSISNSSPSNLRLYNNNFAYTAGAGGLAMYIDDPTIITELNNNNYYSNGASFVYHGAGVGNLAALQAVGTPAGNDSLSVSTDPFFVANDTLIPQSGELSGAGLTLPQVPIDINGVTRSTPPDIGAYEFTPLFNEDVILLEGEINGVCKFNNDSVYLWIQNSIGSNIDFTTDSLTAQWSVTGPINSSGSIVVNSGTLAVGDSLLLTSDGVDLSQAGTYTLSAYIEPNAMNEVAVNDTLDSTSVLTVEELLSVTPKIDTVTSPFATVDLIAESPEFSGGDFFITEICQYNSSFANGYPSGGYPSWLPTVDFMEITGVPNADLAGYTLEQWETSSMSNQHTFPSGTIIGPNGTAVIRIGSGSAGSDAPNYYYDGVTGTESWSSANSVGRIIKDPNGTIVDAVGYPGSTSYTFPAASGVTASDWSGNVPAANGTSGIRLIGPDDNTASNWVVADGSPHEQNPNTVNQGVTVPTGDPILGLTWMKDSVMIDTVPEITVGPFTESGTYEYIAEYQSNCGFTVYDTSLIYVNLTNAELVLSEDALCAGEASGFAAVQSTGGDAPYTYEWYFGTPPTLLPVSSQSDNNLQAGDYLVIINDSNNWPDTVEFTIEEPDTVGLTIVDGGSVSCNGDTDGSLEIEGTGGIAPYTYFWSNGTPGNSINNVPPGPYSVTVTDTNGCEYSEVIEIEEPDAISIATDSTGDVSCFGYADGFIALNVTGGTGSLDYDWSNNETTASNMSLSGGTYEVTVIDANGCEEVESFNIDEPAQLDTSLTNQHNSLLIANYDAANAEYAWWDCDVEELVAGETGREFEPADNGNFALVITVDECRDTSNCFVLNRVSAGEITDEANNWNVYPNPNNGLFNVRLTGNGETDTHMQIIDMQGKVISSKPLGRINGEMVEEVNLNLSSGVYFVKVIQDDQVSVKRVIVQ